MTMSYNTLSFDKESWWVFTLPAVLGSSSSSSISTTYFLLSLFITSVLSLLLTWAFTRAGPAWKHNRTHLGRVPIPGLHGLPILGSLLTLTGKVPHVALACMANAFKAKQLMAFSIGNTPAVVTSDTIIVKEILSSSSFADRPLKRSARELMFGLAIGFAPNGVYWRMLRGISASHLFAPRRIAAHEPSRQEDCRSMLMRIGNEMNLSGSVKLRSHLQATALSNIMGSVFGKRKFNASSNSHGCWELAQHPPARSIRPRR
ncbi:hypothetical protein ZOSMA_3791G00010, partial [Zostera marina]